MTAPAPRSGGGPLAYYNEHDSFAAAWLRELVAAGLIAPGDVDDRSIEDVTASDLAGYTQCHFFAGIGVWSYALRSARWADAAPVWTGSCPCQSFSASGKRGGFSDRRHLWPAWFRLIRECRPHVVFGEQVASPDGLAWLDVVSADVEGAGYAIGAADLCAAGVGAPHIRQRLYFVADAREQRREVERLPVRTRESREDRVEAVGCGEAGIVADTEVSGRRGGRTGEARRSSQRPDGLCDAGGVAIASSAGPFPGARARVHRSELGNAAVESFRTYDGQSDTRDGSAFASGGSGLSGFWDDAEWLPCIDGKARPVEPGTFPLVDGAPARVGRLRGYGNALCAPQASAFIEAYVSLSPASGRSARGRE